MDPSQQVSDDWARLAAEEYYAYGFEPPEPQLGGGLPVFPPGSERDLLSRGIVYDPRVDNDALWNVDGSLKPAGGGSYGSTDLASVAQQSADALGLDLAHKSDWSYDDRIAYIRRFKATILSNQDYFDTAVVQVAEHINTQYQPLDQNANFDLWVANSVLDNQIVQAFGGIGNAVLDAINGTTRGLSNVSKSGGILVPVVILAAAYLFAAGASREGRRALRF